MTGEPYPMTDGRALSVSGERIGQNAQSLEQNFRSRQINVRPSVRKKPCSGVHAYHISATSPSRGLKIRAMQWSRLSIAKA